MTIALAVAAVGVVVTSSAVNAESTVSGIPGVCADPRTPRIVVQADGTQAAAWYCLDDGGNASHDSYVQFSISEAGGAWSTAQVVLENIGHMGSGPEMALNDGRAVVASSRYASSGAMEGPMAVMVDEDGVRPLVNVPESSLPTLATSPAGNIVLAWQQFQPNARALAFAVTGTFDGGVGLPTAISTQDEPFSGDIHAVVDDAGNAVVQSGVSLHTLAGLNQGGTSTWQHQLFYGGRALLLGGGQITAVGIQAQPQGGQFHCVAIQRPIGGSFGAPIDLGPCHNVIAAQNDAGLGLIALARGEAGAMSMTIFVVPPGGAPTAETDLDGGVIVHQVIPRAATVDGNGVATIAWESLGSQENVRKTASLDLAELVGHGGTGRVMSRQADQAGTVAVTSTGSSPAVSHGTWVGSGPISLASSAAGLLAGIWPSGTAFVKGNLSPTVTGLTPKSSPVGGGTTVTITGTRFVKDSIVHFGDVPATSVTYVSPTQLKAVAPAHSPGEVSVRVIAQGSSVPSSQSKFVYGPPPVISGLSPRLGNTAGGTDVTITGSNFVPGTTVKFGYAAATNVRFISSNTIVVSAPKNASGTVAVNATTLAGSSAATNAGQFLYVSNDSGGMPTYAISSMSQVEGNATSSNMTFTITRTGSTGVAGSVKVATEPVAGGATSGTDFTAKAPTAISFPAGASSKTFTVAIKGDLVAEPDESFRVVLSNPVNGDLAAVPYGNGQILNDDSNAPTSLSIGDVSITEGNASTKTVTFTVTRSGKLTGTSSVKFQTVNGTAIAPGDYTAKALTSLSFTAGQTTKTLTVTIKGDTAAEPNESFFVMLSAATGATIADGVGEGTILNDD